MSAPAFHHFDKLGPVCGVRDGVNAEDMDPPEVTCRHCCKHPPVYMAGKRYDYRDGRVFIVHGNPEDLTSPRCGQWSGYREPWGGRGRSRLTGGGR